MFALRFTNGNTTYRLAPSAFDRHGETWESRLLSIKGEAGTVDQWLPGSIRASRVDAVLDDADGTLFDAFLQTDPRGKSIELVWIGENRTSTRLVTTISFWQRDSAAIKLVASDPRLLLLQAPPTPYVRDIDRDAEGADNLLPQVYGYARGLPIGGLTVGDSDLTLYVVNGELEVDALYYDGELVPAADWSREVASQPFSHTRITLGGDRTRRSRGFSWDGGNGSLGPGCAIYLALLNNGVPLGELDTNAFLALDAIILARGLSESATQRNAAVVLTDSSDTLERVITQALETWGVAVYVGEDGRFRPLFPFGDIPPLADLPEIPPLFYSAWASETPRAATHWIAENDYHWQENRWGRLETIRNADNLVSYGREIEGAKLNLWYSRDLIGINFAIDRSILETHRYLRTLAVVDPSEEIIVGDYVKTPEGIALPVQSFVVDGMSFEQEGVEERSHRLSLTRALGTGAVPLQKAITETFALPATPGRLGMDAGSAGWRNLSIDVSDWSDGTLSLTSIVISITPFFQGAIMRLTPEGTNLYPEWETNIEAITLRVPTLDDLVIPGPNSPGLHDFSELNPYHWEFTDEQLAILWGGRSLSEWLDAFEALPNDDARAGEIILTRPDLTDTEDLGSTSVEIGERLDVDLADLVTGGDGGLQFALVEAPSWISINEDGHLVGDAELPGTDDVTYTVRLRTIDRSGQVFIGTYSVEVQYVLSAPSGKTTVRVTSGTDTTAVIEWDAVPGAETYTIVFDRTTITGISGRQYTLTGISRPQNSIVTIQAVNSVGDGPVSDEQTLHFLASPSAPSISAQNPDSLVADGLSTPIPGHFPTEQAWTAGGIDPSQDFCTNPIGTVPSVTATVTLSGGTGISYWEFQSSFIENDFSGASVQRGDIPSADLSFELPENRSEQVMLFVRRRTVGSGGPSPWSVPTTVTLSYPIPDSSDVNFYRGNTTLHVIEVIVDVLLSSIPNGVTVDLLNGRKPDIPNDPIIPIVGSPPLRAQVGDTYLRFTFSTGRGSGGFTTTGNRLALRYRVGGGTCLNEIIGGFFRSENVIHQFDPNPPNSF